MNESLNDNILNCILHKQCLLDSRKKVNTYYERRQKKCSVRVTPVNNDHSTDHEVRAIPWFTRNGKTFLTH